MKKVIRILVVFFVLLTTATAVYFYNIKDQPTDALVLYGNVDIREVDLSFRVPGRLISMLKEEGDAVKEGDTVAVLDSEPYQHELQAAQAQIEKLQAIVEKLEYGFRPQEIQNGEAQVDEANAVFSEAERNFNRQKELLKEKAASRKAYDDAKAQYDIASARLRSAREQLGLLKAGFRREDILAQKADLRAAQAQRDRIATSLHDCTLSAPSNGVIITRILEPGSMVNTGVSVYTLSLHNPVYIRAYITEPYLGHIAPGDEVAITTDSTPTPLKGKIGFISPRAVFTPKNVETTSLRTDLVYRLRITVEDKDDTLRQGMPVTITIL